MRGIKVDRGGFVFHECATRWFSAANKSYSKSSSHHHTRRTIYIDFL